MSRERNVEEFEQVFINSIDAGGLQGLMKSVSSYIDPWLSQRELVGEGKDGVRYKTWLGHFDCPIGGAVALVICVVGFHIFEDLELPYDVEWFAHLESMGLSYELQDSNTIIIYASGERLAQRIRDEFNFDWTSRLVAPDFSKIYRHVFGYFAERRQDLSRLHWREFEEFLASVFAERGYKTVLGPGRADGGVDLRLVENDVLGQLVTIVQAKRYKKPINLEQVAALSGVLYDQNVDSGIFVTTSRYLPSAQEFAQRQQKRITLATSEDVVLWCDAISSRKSAVDVKLELLRHFVPSKDKVVYAQAGATMIFHRFAYVLSQTPSAALLLLVPSARVPHEGRIEYSTGYEVPDLSRPVDIEATTITARVKSDYLWGDDARLYVPWNGKPLWFDLND